MNSTSLRKMLKHVDKDLQLSRNQLEQQMSRQSGLYHYYAMAYARAMKDEKRVQLRLSMLESKIYRELSLNHSRVTEKMVKAECHIRPSWIKLSQFVDEHSHSVDVLKGVVQALMHKKDMLVNIGATVRVEMAGETRINK